MAEPYEALRRAALEGMVTNYEKDIRRNKFNLLAYGPIGAGKTELLRTARRPILIHSFDPGGLKTIRDAIDGKDVVVDTRFEVEDANHPTSWVLYDKVYNYLKSISFFNYLGTYAVDSITLLSQAILHWVMQQDGRAGGSPQQNDWLPQMSILENVIKKVLDLPCDCIFTAHPDIEKDETIGRMFVGPMVTGKLKTRLPILFDEIYYLDVKEASDGVEYYMLTRKTGLFVARSRLGMRGLLDMYEKPDVKYILKKVGMSADDLPTLDFKGEEVVESEVEVGSKTNNEVRKGGDKNG